MKKTTILAIFFSFFLVLGIALGNFGEVVGHLNYSLAPNSTQTLQWGLVNWYSNDTMQYYIMGSSYAAGENNTPNITFSSSNGILTPNSVVEIQVTVNSFGIEPNQSFTGLLSAYAEPINTIGVAQGGATIRVGTSKQFTIDITADPTTTVTTTIPAIAKAAPASSPTPALIGVMIVAAVAIGGGILYKNKKAKNA